MVPRITFIIGYSGSLIPLLKSILDKLQEKYAFEYRIVTPYRLCDEDLEYIKEANTIFIYSPKLPDNFDEVLQKIMEKTRIVAIDENHLNLNNVDTSHFNLATKYLKYGGKDNLYSLTLLLLKIAGYNDISLCEPKEMPWHGIYHPDYGVFDNIEVYLAKYPYRSRPLVGILFYRSDWLYGRTVLVDKLVKEFERQGLGVIPVFTYGFRDRFLGTPHTVDTITKFFFINGKPFIDTLVNITSFYILDHGRSSGWSSFSEGKGVSTLKHLDVPIIQCPITYSKTPDEWLEDPRGVDYMTIVYRIAMPEVDGAIEPVLAAGSRIDGDGYKKILPIDKHVDYIVRRVKKWILLRRKKPCERRIAIVLINPPCKSLEANVAVGLGLDVPESVVRFLKKLRDLGYNVGDCIPHDGEELVKLIMERKAISEFRWTSVEEIVAHGGALDLVGLDQYLEWFNELPENIREAMVKAWGDPRSILEESRNRSLAGMVYNGKFVVPGLRFGNVIVLLQPKRGCAGSRCDGYVCKILHDPTVPPPHQWLAVYRWITRVFKADVMIHFGTHGYLEFLPGKHTGLSWMCWPEITIDDIPHLYVYVVSNPMEGVMAKRRGYAVIIDHLYPVLAKADVLSEVDSLLTQYSHAKSMEDYGRASIIYKQLIEKAGEYNIPLPENASGEQVVEAIHRYIHMIRDTYINMGLHVLGSPPSDPERLAEYVVAIMSFDTYRTHSIKRVLAEYLGLDYRVLKEKPLEIGRPYGKTYRELLDIVHGIAVNTFKEVIGSGRKDYNYIIDVLRKESIKFLGREPCFNKSMERVVVETIRYGLDVVELIRRCNREVDQLVHGVSGGYIEPGASGALTRGKIDVLPTGRNFYLIDPRTLPTKAAWLVGKETAEKLLRYYLEKHGRYPESVGEVLWSIDAYKADGEMLAQILYLLGVEPVWDENGVVKDLQIIPLEKLSRPRIDVVVRISGIVRDTLPNYIELIDKAVARVVVLDEPLEMNYVKKHYLENLGELIKHGVEPERARKFARYRVYGAPPGAYGVGVNLAVEASAWKTEEDLAKTWIQWSGYAYSIDSYGESAHEALMYSLRSVDIVNRDHVSDEHDILNCCSYFAYHGGFYNTVKALTKRSDVEVVSVDTRNTLHTNVYSMNLEIERSVRTKLLNKKWIEEMKNHGYRGASEFQRKILHLYGWASTTRLVKDWVFNEIAETYVLDEEMRKWFIEHNVWALEEITRRLIEAAVRNIWKPPKEILEKLRKIYSEIEGILEDGITMPADIQGGSIDIVTPEQVKTWSQALDKVEAIWSKLVSRKNRFPS